jgi:hypothetical protein
MEGASMSAAKTRAPTKTSSSNKHLRRKWKNGVGSEGWQDPGKRQHVVIKQGILIEAIQHFQSRVLSITVISAPTCTLFF